MSRRGWWTLALAIAVLAIAASANSIPNGFAFDDEYVIQREARIHSLAGWWREFAHTYWSREWGGDGYRPLTILAFRAEWALGGGNPLPFHLANVALHAAMSVAAFWLATGVLPIAAAWIVAAFYAVHPVHVEAIANVVGQSELAAALLVVLAMALFIHGRRSGSIAWPRWLLIGALYAAACLFKEHAIVLPALLVLAEMTVVQNLAPLRQRLTGMRPALLALVAVALAYLWARSRVVVGGGAGFAPYIAFQVLKFSTVDRVLTMIGASPEWLRLLLWPARLHADYSPPHIEIAQGPSIAQLPGLLVLTGIIGLGIACWRRNPVVAFGIGWLVVTLLPASNFLVPAGFIIAERTLYLPSLGAMIAIGGAVPWLYARLERRRLAGYAAAALAVTVLALGIARSYTRNRVWRDTETLLRDAVRSSPDSYRAHFLLGTHLFQKKRKTEGEMYYRRAMSLFPHDPAVLFALAEQYRTSGICEPAIPLYEAAFAIAPFFSGGQIGLAGCLLETGRLGEAKQMALTAIRNGARPSVARVLIRTADARRDSLAAQRSRGDTMPMIVPSAARRP